MQSYKTMPAMENTKRNSGIKIQGWKRLVLVEKNNMRKREGGMWGTKMGAVFLVKLSRELAGK